MRDAQAGVAGAIAELEDADLPELTPFDEVCWTAFETCSTAREPSDGDTPNQIGFDKILLYAKYLRCDRLQTDFLLSYVLAMDMMFRVTIENNASKAKTRRPSE